METVNFCPGDAALPKALREQRDVDSDEVLNIKTISSRGHRENVYSDLDTKFDTSFLFH